MLTTVQPQSETSGENSIPISSITPLSVSNEDLSVSNSETMTTDPKLSADSRMKVDERDPAEPDSNEGTEGEGVDGEGEDEGEGDGEIQHCPFPTCLKEFTSRWSLTRHIRTHTGEKPFKCSICGKEFVQKCSLKRHEQTHSQEKQWICDHDNCGKRFKLKEYLDVHKRTHVKLDAEQAPQEDEDQVVQDAADAAGALIDQLRQRLVRMSVRHHEQLFAHQQREMHLMQSFQECSVVLDQAVNLLNDRNPGHVPPYMVEASMRFTAAVNMSSGPGQRQGQGGQGQGQGGASHHNQHGHSNNNNNNNTNNNNNNSNGNGNHNSHSQHHSNGNSNNSNNNNNNNGNSHHGNGNGSHSGQHSNNNNNSNNHANQHGSGGGHIVSNSNGHLHGNLHSNMGGSGNSNSNGHGNGYRYAHTNEQALLHNYDQRNAL